jgi:uncharacterized oligopeptide transporter (OPT) family protein
MDRELSARALGLGAAAGAVIAAANVYAGLKLGYVDAGTTTIVLVAFAVFGRRGMAPLEANAAQVVGSSAGAMAVTAGLIGPVPALALSGHPVAPAIVIAWSVVLAAFGTLLAVPFRDSLIVTRRLAFPTARAAGEVIQRLFVEGARPAGSVRWMIAGALVAAAITVGRDALHVVPAALLIAAPLSIGVAASPLLFGVGLLVGARIGLSVLLGAAIAWLGIAPALVERGLAQASYASAVSWTLWPGAALMVTGSVMALVLGGGALIRALRGAGRARGGLAVLGCALVLIALAWRGFGIHPGFAALAVGLAAVCSVAAMHATGETDNTPAGPLGGLTQIVVGAVGPGGVGTPLAAGAIVNGAAVHAATMMNAYKAGEVVGNRAPARLVVAQLAGVVFGAVAAAVAYWLIREAYGLGTAAMPAPGATSWKATADAVAGGAAGMPAGAPIAAAIAAAVAIGLTVAERWTRALPSAIAMGVGFLVPASIAAALAIGALAFAAIARGAPAWHARSGPPLAAGLIVGEAFAGVVIAAIVVAAG